MPRYSHRSRTRKRNRDHQGGSPPQVGGADGGPVEPSHAGHHSGPGRAGNTRPYKITAGNLEDCYKDAKENTMPRYSHLGKEPLRHLPDIRP